MSSPTWAGGNVLTFGDGRQQSTTTWGDLIPVADPPRALADLGLDLRHSPRRVWKAQPSVRKVVSFAAESMSMVPLHVYQRVSDTDRTRDADGVAEQMLRNPYPFVTGPRLIADAVVDWMLYDRWLLLLTEDGLRRIPAGLIDIKYDFLGGLTALRIRTAQGLVDVTDLDVAFDAGWSGDEEGGITPLRTLGTLMEEQTRATTWRSQQWDNAAKITGTLNTEQNLSRNVRDRLAASWREFRDSQAGGTPILDNGTKFTPFDFKPSANDDLEGRRLTDAEVASFFHIPPELVGARDGTFSNIKAFRQMLYGPTLGPKMTRFEAALNARLIPALTGRSDTYVEFEREAAMAGSFEEQASVYQKAAGGPYMTRNEVRARQNLPRIEGADELIVPSNVVEGGLASPADTAPDNTGEDAEDSEKTWWKPREEQIHGKS